MKQNCGNCKWAQSFKMTKHKPPRFAKYTVSMCLFDIFTIPMPDAFSNFHRRYRHVQYYVTPTDGENCPCWAAKEQQ